MSTHTAITQHIVFFTKNRMPALKQDRREDLFRYISGIIKNRQGHIYRINGVEDHLHILTSLHATVCLADFVKEIKLGSSAWIKENSIFRQFLSWQEGYGAFTCSNRDRAGLIEYIKAQEEHHRKFRFAEEYRKLLVEAGAEFDERYML